MSRVANTDRLGSVWGGGLDARIRDEVREGGGEGRVHCEMGAAAQSVGLEFTLVGDGSDLNHKRLRFLRSALPGAVKRRAGQASKAAPQATRISEQI